MIKASWRSILPIARKPSVVLTVPRDVTACWWPALSAFSTWRRLWPNWKDKVTLFRACLHVLWTRVSFLIVDRPVTQAGQKLYAIRTYILHSEEDSRIDKKVLKRILGRNSKWMIVVYSGLRTKEIYNVRTYLVWWISCKCGWRIRPTCNA